jgi:hypothetical protein
MQIHHNVNIGEFIPTNYHYFPTSSPNTMMNLFHFCITLNVPAVEIRTLAWTIIYEQPFVLPPYCGTGTLPCVDSAIMRK